MSAQHMFIPKLKTTIYYKLHDHVKIALSFMVMQTVFHHHIFSTNHFFSNEI